MGEHNLDFDQIINRKNTKSLKFDFAKRRGKPEDVLPLWVADMDFKTSSAILDAIQERVDHGIFGYTEIDDEYRQVVVDWFKNSHHMDIQANWIVPTPGVVYALAMAVRAFTNVGDGVLIQQPVYYPFSEVIADNDRKIVSNDLVLGEDGRYHIDFEDFENKIRDNNIKLFIFCSPHNPVGRVWTVDELEEIARICLKYKVIVVSDEIHQDFTYQGFEHTPLYNVNEELRDYLITATSPAKTFNLPGLQISNILISNRRIRHVIRRQIAATGYSQLNTFGIIACQAAYQHGQNWFTELKKYLQENLSVVREYLQTNLPQIKLVEPEGTYLVWLDFRDLGLDEDALEDLIVNKAKLWLDSGSIFGATGKGFERINIATSRIVLKEALDRIKGAVDSL